MKYKFGILLCILLISNHLFAQKFTEMNRNVVAISTNDSVFISWRLLASDSNNETFNVYRQLKNETAIQLNQEPISKGTWFIDAPQQLNEDLTYIVTKANEKPAINSNNSFKLRKAQYNKPYLTIPLNVPENDTVHGVTYSYSANDASIGDVDGDGEFEIILKWQPSLAKNPPQTGFTGKQLIDAYKMDGTLLWRIDLGVNIRAGAAYTQFLVYDFDGDGCAEMICKTADGTIDGTGNSIGDSTKDWRTYGQTSRMYGKIVDGPEYLTIFNGATGAAISTVDYLPNRYPLDGWGGVGGNGNNDDSGGRSDRFTAGVAYLDGIHPSVVFVRGWYGRTAAVAWDFKNGELKKRWIFDSKNAQNPYSGQGNHQLSIADVDNDGKDEICVGSMTIDDNGKGLYSTGLRHGDALHLADIDPDSPGLEVFGIHENEGKTKKLNTPGVALFRAADGKILFSKGPAVDVGRGVAADIDPTHDGFENWGGPGKLRDCKGNTISENTPSSCNFVIWWDGDLTRELLDYNRIDKWDWKNETTINLLTAKECVSNNYTKGTPCLSADFLGDWREEVIWRTNDSKELHIYTTIIPTAYRITNLLQDRQYRLSVVWQNVSYNQPPHTSFNIRNAFISE